MMRLYPCSKGDCHISLLAWASFAAFPETRSRIAILRCLPPWLQKKWFHVAHQLHQSSGSKCRQDHVCEAVPGNRCLSAAEISNGEAASCSH